MWSGDDPSRNAEEQANDNNINQNNNNQDTEMSVASTQASKERRNGRERSLSVPCRSAAADVDSVMSKAKRASSFLWMLLHSQVGVHILLLHGVWSRESLRLNVSCFPGQM